MLYNVKTLEYKTSICNQVVQIKVLTNLTDVQIQEIMKLYLYGGTYDKPTPYRITIKNIQSFIQKMISNKLDRHYYPKPGEYYIKKLQLPPDAYIIKKTTNY